MILGSLCGGTNAGIVVDFAAFVRYRFGDLRFTGYYLMPSVLEAVFAGKPTEWIRVNQTPTRR